MILQSLLRYQSFVLKTNTKVFKRPLKNFLQ
jgi:hypothetical protein